MLGAFEEFLYQKFIVGSSPPCNLITYDNAEALENKVLEAIPFWNKCDKYKTTTPGFSNNILDNPKEWAKPPILLISFTPLKMHKNWRQQARSALASLMSLM